MPATEHFDTIVIGGGQAGLATGYYLKQQGRNFVILDANARTGDAWRNRWDSLRLFTPARFDGLAGMPFPAQDYSLPTKDEMAGYLDAYAQHFQLPVRTGVKVDHLSREGDRFAVMAGDQRFEAENVVVAMATFQQPKIPTFAAELDPDIVQLHSSAYRNPTQLRDGGVLIVGAGNSGAEIAMEIIRTHPTWLAGRDVGHIPFRVDGSLAKLLVPSLFRVVFHRLLSTATPIGRKARPKFLSGALPLIRVKPKDLTAAAVARVPRVAGARDGRPLLEDGSALDVANVIWATGYTPGFSWIDLPVFGEREPLHTRGVVPSQPGLYFVGLEFLYAVSSAMVHGVSRDAEYVARHIASRSETLTAQVNSSPDSAYASR
jgi:putative flavoprotein involved in K+ transport